MLTVLVYYFISTPKLRNITARLQVFLPVLFEYQHSFIFYPEKAGWTE